MSFASFQMPLKWSNLLDVVGITMSLNRFAVLVAVTLKRGKQDGSQSRIGSESRHNIDG